MEVEQGRVKSGAVELNYMTAGQGQVVVLVHGLSGSNHWWHKTLPALAAHYRVYALDLAGFGGSRTGPSFELRTAANQLIDFLDKLGVEKASLTGHSMGGFIVADLAARHPDRVEKLVLVDAAALPFENSFLDRGLGLALAACKIPPAFWPVFLADAYRAGPRTLWRAANELMAADIARDLELIQAETLVVWGKQDHLVPLSLGVELTRRLHHARFEIIPGAAHTPMLERPAEFNRLLLDFLRN
jgi:pimeloyl-ACP methyl ester carboxylesterase